MGLEDYLRQGEPRAIAAGLLVALTAPLVLCPVLAWITLGQREVIFRDFSYLSNIPLAYYLGSAQSFTGGTLVALAIRQHGWISARWWAAYSIAFGLAPGTLLFPIIGNTGLGIALYFLSATLLASLLLRFLVIGLGLMRRA